MRKKHLVLFLMLGISAHASTSPLAFTCGVHSKYDPLLKDIPLNLIKIENLPKQSISGQTKAKVFNMSSDWWHEWKDASVNYDANRILIEFLMEEKESTRDGSNRMRTFTIYRDTLQYDSAYEEKKCFVSSEEEVNEIAEKTISIRMETNQI